ncbi:VanZ family protein [Altererythrobacter sp. GH1-8]|uniref:VanZ family protein n=1 Tax=Altererythrobacter sp. GH1-8 TaxID=3349333 RepID=UPI00374D8A67
MLLVLRAFAIAMLFAITAALAFIDFQGRGMSPLDPLALEIKTFAPELGMFLLAHDKLVHVAAAFTMALLGALALPILSLARLGVLLIALSGASELAQLSPEISRKADWFDFGANLLGIAVALLLVRIIRVQFLNDPEKELLRKFGSAAPRKELPWLQWLVRLVFFSAAAFALVMASLPQPPPLPGAPQDKLLHILAFTVLATLIAPAFPRARIITLFCVLAVFGAAIEIIQMIPELGREASVMDWVADMGAAAITLSFIAAVRRWGFIEGEGQPSAIADK